jgi:hypothetical protein
VTTHSMVATSAPRARRISGSTAFTTLPSSADMKVAIPTVRSTHHFRSTAPIYNFRMHTFVARCHCGNVEVRFETEKSPAELQPRSCQCTFCTRHRSRTVADPQGRATIHIRDEAQLSRYQWGTRSAEFLVCRACGGYAGALMTSGARKYMTVNVNLVEDPSQFTRPALPVNYDAESPDERRKRRESVWTPAEYA